VIHPVATAIELPSQQIEELCRRRGVRRLAVFGSVLRADFRPESDVDFLVEFEAGAEKPWASHYSELREELERLLGRAVEVVDWVAVERSRNPYRRYGILSTKRLLYAA
jgi:hypothetical protein